MDLDRGKQVREFQMSFEEIEKILGFHIDHSFLQFKELPEYGFSVKKISMKEQTVAFDKNDD